ncbi:MAG TPA: hypothetical protein VMZ51_06140 [Acidimicrobiales bacterium]|nr:hypothetical protein [Acidimicrobiales bacterium]
MPPPTTTTVGSPVDPSPGRVPGGFPVTGLAGGSVLVLLALVLVSIGLVLQRIAAARPSRKEAPCAR